MKSENTKSEEAGLGSLVPYFFRYKWRIFFSLLVLVISKILAVADPYVTKKLIDALIENGVDVDLKLITILVVLYFALRFGGNLLDGAKDYLFAKVQANVRRLVSLDIFQHVISLPVSFHTGRATGAVSRMITRGTSGLQNIFFFLTFNVIPTVIEIFFMLIIFINLFPLSFTFTFTIFIVTYVAFTIIFTEKRQKVLLDANKKDDKANSKSIDAILNYETVKYFTNEKYEHRKYNKSLQKWVQSTIKSTKMGANLNMGQGLIVTAGLTTILVLAVREYLAGQATIGDFVLVTTYLTRIAIPLGFLGFVYRVVKEGFADIDEMFKLLNIKNEVLDKPDALELENTKGHFRFHDVSFSYNDEREIIENINLDILPNTSVALVGYSGSGKSTIAKLILRLYDISSGSITLDGVDLRDLKQKSLREKIGVVAQDTILFNDTIFNNIAYGKIGAKHEEVVSAAKIANLHDFIENDLPDSYKTIVGERGVKLSGGEKQRVAIARMIIKNPCILLFDEATASLDTRSEKIIQESIKSLSKGERTTIVIAHRLSTIVDFDNIIVLKNGKIIEQGDHHKLLSKNGAYAELWKAQSSDD